MILIRGMYYGRSLVFFLCWTDYLITIWKQDDGGIISYWNEINSS
jgi:hypothetical protein